MSVGFIDSSCGQRHAVVSAVLTSLRGSAAPADRSVAESGADTSRGWCGFPPLLVDITRYCRRCFLMEARAAGREVAPVPPPYAASRGPAQIVGYVDNF